MRPDGTVIGTTNAAGIFSFSVNDGVTDDPSGTSGNKGAWTGLNKDWTVDANTCPTWSSNSGSGACGFVGATDNTLISDSAGGGQTGCSNTKHLFCVEQ